MRMKIEKKKNINRFYFAPSFFFHLIHVQLPATITTPTKHSEVEERVREGCSRDTVYRFAPRSIKYYIFNLQRHTSLQTHDVAPFKMQRHGCHLRTASITLQSARILEAHVRTDQNQQHFFQPFSPPPRKLSNLIDPTIFHIFQKCIEKRVHSCVLQQPILRTFNLPTHFKSLTCRAGCLHLSESASWDMQTSHK